MENHLSRRDVLAGALPAMGMVSGVASALALGGPLAAMVDAQTTAPAQGPVESLLNSAFKDGEYVLPALPYAYEALEPHIDAETMHLHHDKHHLAYVKGLNKAFKDLAALSESGTEANPPLLAGLQEDLSFNAGGHVLHTIFWATMAPSAGGEPTGALADAIKKDFGSVESFRTQFSRVAAGVKGSGWALLAYLPLGERLAILQLKQHDLQLPASAIPLLPLDVWEHAYYLKYHNARADYVKAWWNVVNWPAVDQALKEARD
jgi:Fe-Mn family superoxide dismutase